jgi:L-histidine N-alpha-methyltransferase
MTHDTLAPTIPADRSRFAEDVAYYLSLTPRQLPSHYLYDELGSALFEAICRLPWYRIARLEHELLRLRGGDIFRRLEGLSTLVELGPGNGDKLATLLQAESRGPMTVHLVDISPHALRAAVSTLGESRDLTVVTHQGTYESGFIDAMKGRQGTGQALVLFLGSNIGNFDPPGADAFLRGIRAALMPGDAILLGTDLVKPERDLVDAYDDPLGVTAAFNKNLLVRANCELGADFDINRFAHRAVWNGEMSRIEMYLVSTIQQEIRVPAARLEISFQAGETIWTESSYKYQPDGVLAMLNRARFAALDQWVADGFALTLAAAT